MSDRKPRVVIDPLRQQQQGRRPPPRMSQQAVKDIRQTKEYKVAARRWVSTIVALPILMYTSYILYERTYGNQQQKRLGGNLESSSMDNNEK